MTEEQQNDLFVDALIAHCEAKEVQMRSRRLASGTVLLSFISEAEREADERGLVRDHSVVAEELLSNELADLAECSVMHWNGY